MWTGPAGSQSTYFRVCAVSGVPDLFFAVGQTEHVFGFRDGLVTRVALTGNVMWSHVTGGGAYDNFFGVAATRDGGCVVARSMQNGGGTSLTGFGHCSQ